MRAARLSITFAVAALSSAASAASDDICDRVAAFHRARFDSTEQPAGRRWIELHWTGFWMDFERGFGKACRTSPDGASRDLCRWLVQHSSTEFPNMVPARILTCFGYRFPHANRWRGWKSDISLLSQERWLLLEIDLSGTETESGVIRLSSFARGKDEALIELPPLKNIPAANPSSKR